MKTFKEFIKEKVSSKTTREKVKEFFMGTPILQDPYMYIKKRYSKQLNKIISKIREDVLKEEWGTKELSIIQDLTNKKAKDLVLTIKVQSESRIPMSNAIQEKLLDSLIWSNIASYILNKG